MRLTPAQRRVLAKARGQGGVSIVGGFSGGPAPFQTELLPSRADRRAVIERMVARGLLEPGPFFNSFVLRAK